ncbi:unnamed protein product [Acanthoscelides obtectus]|uniref:SKICH domain-containing protein n=1 Tax=Acanthoscelides obtectus TaxID=200917 RepID=A0A9P0LCX9_ACAOB|nr:unnamed protein product [Acanthoscelides obtectus]CAK1636153.1 Tax1-binding protein 1 homolog A [Acanthoscelides obtectus]
MSETDRASCLETSFVSMRPAVEFLDVLDQYPYSEDLTFTFAFNDYTPQEGDRVAIYKVGWSFVKDYIVFEWVSAETKSAKYSVVFNKHILPKNNVEIYQICYITAENEIQGASSSFQFISEKPKAAQQPHTTTVPNNCAPQFNLQTNRDDEIKQLKEENSMLKGSLKLIIAGQNAQKTVAEEMRELKKTVGDLKIVIDVHQAEIDTLKSYIREGVEDYKKLKLETVKLEKKLDKLKIRKGDGKDDIDIDALKSIPPFPFIYKTYDFTFPRVSK